MERNFTVLNGGRSSRQRDAERRTVWQAIILADAVFFIVLILVIRHGLEHSQLLLGILVGIPLGFICAIPLGLLVYWLLRTLRR